MENDKKQNSFLLVIIVFLTSFLLGFYTSSKFEYKDIEIINKDSLVNEINSKLVDKKLELWLFWQVYNIVTKYYYSSWDLVNKDLEYGIITGFVNSLWDKFSEFFPPEETKTFNDALSWDFEWIGAVIQKNEIWIIVDRVLKWSPALNSWVMKWDIILEANWKELKDLTTTQAVWFIKWPAGSKVSLKILRVWEKEVIQKEITRSKITIPSVDTQDIWEKEIWYISLNIFWEHTSKEFSEILSTYNKKEIKWIIIDLRDNWGGILQIAVEILSNFIEKWKVLVTTKYINEKLNEKYYSENFWDIFNKKIVILINWNSASASEIMAWAMRDYNKAILVWEKSFWKWSVQQPFNLTDGSMLKLTIAKWYTPNDKSIDKNGIEPDVKVEYKKEDYEKKYDRQLEVAKQVLKEYIKLDNITLTLDKFPKTWSWETTWSWINTSTWTNK